MPLRMYQREGDMSYEDRCKLLKWPTLSDRRTYLSLFILFISLSLRGTSRREPWERGCNNLVFLCRWKRISSYRTNSFYPSWLPRPHRAHVLRQPLIITLGLRDQIIITVLTKLYSLAKLAS